MEFRVRPGAEPRNLPPCDTVVNGRLHPPVRRTSRERCRTKTSVLAVGPRQRCRIVAKPTFYERVTPVKPPDGIVGSQMGGNGTNQGGSLPKTRVLVVEDELDIASL